MNFIKLTAVFAALILALSGCASQTVAAPPESYISNYEDQGTPALYQTSNPPNPVLSLILAPILIPLVLVRVLSCLDLENYDAFKAFCD